MLCQRMARSMFTMLEVLRGVSGLTAVGLSATNGWLSFLLSDGLNEPMMRHLDGARYLDPEQRAKADLPPYPTDWTDALSVSRRSGEAT